MIRRVYVLAWASHQSERFVLDVDLDVVLPEGAVGNIVKCLSSLPSALSSVIGPFLDLL